MHFNKHNKFIITQLWRQVGLITSHNLLRYRFDIYGHRLRYQESEFFFILIFLMYHMIQCDHFYYFHVSIFRAASNTHDVYVVHFISKLAGSFRVDHLWCGFYFKGKVDL